MNSVKAVSRYETASSGILEWEIQHVSSHFQKCYFCWSDQHHGRRNCNPEENVDLSSRAIKLTAGGGRQSKWHFQLERKTAAQSKDLKICLYFDGLFGADGSTILEPCKLKYNARTEISLLDKVKILHTEDGEGRTIDPKDLPVLVYRQAIPFLELKSVWPSGNLKVSVDIFHLSNNVNEVIHNGQFLDLLALKNTLPVPVPGCYGNLCNNSELSDFKISCKASTFYTHKLILSVRSPVFRVMIESGLKESVQNELKIEDMTVKTVGLMLEYIYKGTLKTFPVGLKERIELLDCAEKYELDGLKSICMRRIFSNLPTEKEVLLLVMAASKYGANDRVSKAIKDFCAMNHAKLIQNPEYKKLFLANPQAFMN